MRLKQNISKASWTRILGLVVLGTSGLVGVWRLVDMAQEHQTILTQNEDLRTLLDQAPHTRNVDLTGVLIEGERPQLTARQIMQDLEGSLNFRQSSFEIKNLGNGTHLENGFLKLDFEISFSGHIRDFEKLILKLVATEPGLFLHALEMAPQNMPHDKKIEVKIDVYFVSNTMGQVG